MLYSPTVPTRQLKPTEASVPPAICVMAVHTLSVSIVMPWSSDWPLTLTTMVLP